MKFFIALFSFVLFPFALQAQDKPPVPAPIEALAQDGAQIEYLGDMGGLDGWVTIRNGQEQYFYVTKDGQAFVMGLLFDKEGRLITRDQVRSVLQSENGEILNSLAGGSPQGADPSFTPATDRLSGPDLKTPAEQLFFDIENSNWVALGDPSAPVIYSFIDPQCPHCHDFINDLRANYINNGLIQVRIVPVGFSAKSLAQAAFLLASPTPEQVFYAHLDGDERALPAEPSINKQGVQKNLSVMQSWNLSSTPFNVYRDKNGTIQILQGRARDIPALISTLQ